MLRRLALVLAAAVVLLAACGTAAPSSQPATASSTVGRYRLDLVVDRSLWRAGDLVTGAGTLTNTGSSTVTAFGSGSGILSFEFAEVGGSRQLLGVMTADCGPHDLPAAKPIIARLAASGASSSSGADAWIAGANDPGGARLPAGTWDITARARFTDGDCFGPSFNIDATVRVTVLG